MNKIFLYTIILSFLSISSFAQDEKQKEKQDLGTEVINVVKAYNPEVSDAFKIKSSPNNKIEDVEKQKLEYNPISTEVTSTFSPSKIKSKTQRKKTRSKNALDNYVVLGYGNYKTPLLELYMNNAKVKEHRYGVHVQHLSSEGGIENVRFNDAFMNTSIDAFYWKQFKNYQLKSSLEYKYQSMNWYGVPDVVITDDLVKSLNVGQYYQTIQGDVSYTYNGRKDDALFRKTSFSTYRMSDRYDSYENRIRVDGDFLIPLEGHYIKINADLDFIDTYFAQNLDATGDISNRFVNIGLTPSFEMIKDNVTLNLGLAFVYSADLVGDDSKFKVFPKISASVNVIDDLMIVYSELDGEMHQNSLQTAVDEIPFLAPTMDVRPTSVDYEFIVGVRGKLMKGLEYNTSASYRRENGFIQYLDSKDVFPIVGTPKGWNAWNSFNAVQDTVHVFSFYAEIEYKLMKDLNVSANLMLNNYTSSSHSKVYNKPNLKISAAVDYRFMEDFTVGTSMYFVGQRSYLNNPVSATVTEEGDLPSYFDLNFSAGYDVTKKLGTFLRLNNVINQKYELYKNYPVQGFQVMAGVTYKF